MRNELAELAAVLPATKLTRAEWALLRGACGQGVGHG